MAKPSLASRVGVASAALAAIICQPSLFAAQLYWDGNAIDPGAGEASMLEGSWGIDSMWNSDPAGEMGNFTEITTAADNLFFVAGPSATSGSVNFNPTVTDTQAANSITFQSSGTQTLSGGTAINLGAGGLIGSQYSYNTTDRGAVTINSPVSLTASQSWINNGINAMAVSGAISGTGAITIQNTAAGTTGTFTLSNASINHTGMIINLGSGGATTTISGGLGPAVTGITQNSTTSLLVLSGVNTAYTGTTTLTSGILRAATSGTADIFTALGSGPVNVTAGTLQLKANGSGNGGKTIVSTNNVTTGSSGVTIDVNNNGNRTGNTFQLGNLSLAAGQFNVTTVNNFGLKFAGTTTLAGNTTLNAAAALTLTGAIGDGGSNASIIKTGSATLTFGTTNTYTGTTTVLAGTLALGADAPSGLPGSLGNSTSTVLVGDTTGSADAGINLTGGFTVDRDIIVQGGNSGVVTIGSSAQSQITCTISGDIALGSGGVGHNAVFISGNFKSMVYSGTISGLGGITTSSGTDNKSIVAINGNNTYSGGTTISAGNLLVGLNSALGSGTITINGGLLGTRSTGITLANPQTWAGDFTGGFSTFSGGKGMTTTGTNTIVGGDRTVSVGGVILNINGTITDGAGSYGLIFKNGTGESHNTTVALGGANTFDGGLTLIRSSQTMTVTTSTATAAGSGQVTLNNASNTILQLAAPLTVASLSSAIGIPTFVGGTDGTPGTQDLVFTGGGGTGAAGTVTINSGGAITGVTITNYGKNYSSAPTVALSTSGAATGTVASTFGSSSVNLQANTLTISGSNVSPATYAGVISGTNGSLVKDGSGTQTLSGTNTYSGSTTVNDGTLAIQQAYLSDASAVVIGASGKLALDFDETNGAVSDTVDSLTINGVAQAPGVYGATGSGADPSHTDNTHFSGAGTLIVTNGPVVVGGYGPWIDSFFTGVTDPLIVGAGADPDMDGVKNIAEFAFNGNPSSGTDNGKVYQLTGVASGYASTNKVLILTIAVRKGTPSPWTPMNTATIDGITYTIEGGTDLSSLQGTIWSNGSAVTTGLPAITDTVNYEYRSFVLDGSAGLTNKGFLRAKVEGTL